MFAFLEFKFVKQFNIWMFKKIIPKRLINMPWVSLMEFKTLRKT